MAKPNEVFTEVGGDHSIGRRVKLIEPLSGRYVGETGTVTAKFPWQAGFMVMVTWDIGFADGEKRVDYFRPEHFRQLLREV